MTEGGAEWNAGGGVQEAIDGGTAPFELEAEHVAETVIENARRQFMIGMIVLAGIPDLRDARLFGEPIGEAQGVIAGGTHAQIERGEAALGEPTVERVRRQAP